MLTLKRERARVPSTTDPHGPKAPRLQLRSAGPDYSKVDVLGLRLRYLQLWGGTEPGFTKVVSVNRRTELEYDELITGRKPPDSSYAL